MEKMKIAVIHPFLDVRGGAERKLILLHQGLLQDGHDARLFTINFNPNKTFAEFLPKHESIEESPTESKLFWIIWTFIKLLLFNPDRIVVSNYPANIPAAIYKLLRPYVKTIWICNEVPALLSTKNSFLWREIFRIEKFLSQIFDRIIANSKNTRHEILKHYGKCTDVVYSGVEIYKNNEPHVSEEIKESMNDSFLFCLSRIHRHKNINFLSQVAAAFPEEKILVAGKGPDIAHLDKMRSSHPNIKYLGAVSEDEKFALYKNAKSFLFLPLNEPLGVTIMESLTQNTPVIAFNSGGPKETVLAGKNGGLANDESEYLKLISFWREKRVSNEFGIQYIEKDFSNRRMVNDFKSLVYQ